MNSKITVSQPEETIVESPYITKPGMMNIIESGGRINFYNDQIAIKEVLDPGKVYEVTVDHIFGTISLRPGNPLELPKKIYDFEKSFRDQILTTLRSLRGNNNIGVLLEGYKGQGKSVIAKQLAIESGLPIVMISSSIPSKADINQFLGQIKQDFVLLIDEFEKLFKDDDKYSGEEKNNSDYHGQNTFLSLLDGTLGLNHKRLVIFTTNSEIGDKFINRPSRIRYYKKYNYMSQEVFDAILDDKLENQEFRQDLEDNINVANCTIDILTTIIEEINIQQKPYSQFKEFFNHKERDVVYFRYKKNRLTGQFEYMDDLSLRKEINIENQSHALGGNSRILKNEEGRVLYYECKEWEYDKDDKEFEVRNVYKLAKQEYSFGKGKMMAF